MVIATKLYVAHPDLPLTPTIRSNPDVELGVFSEAGTDPEHDAYIFWFEQPDTDTLRRSLEEDHTVDSFSVIVEDEQRLTVLIEYTDEVMLVTPVIVDLGGLTVESRSYSNGWMIHVQLHDHQALFALNEYAKENDIHLDILELHQNEERDERSEFGLTEAQREALVSAYVQGYYDVPRRTTLKELASTLDISLTAVSGRLRRGSARLIEDVVIEDSD
jgi:predicted DNA binding protein